MTMFGRPKAAPPPVPEPEKKPETPALTKEDVATMLDTAMTGVADRLGEALGSLREGVETLAARPVTVTPTAPPAAAAPAITDDEIDTALLSGTGAAKSIRALVDRAVNDQAAVLMRDHIAPLQNTGISSLAELNKKVTLGNMPHYNRFKAEIDERLSRLDPAVQTNTNALAMVYFAVVGEHTEELNKETEEATIRRIQEAAAGGGEGGATGAAAPGTGAGGGGKREEKKTPSAEVLGGVLGQEALAHKGNGGQDQDEFARGMGYPSWDAYIKQSEDLEAAETSSNA
jgi:hypothetical protein